MDKFWHKQWVFNHSYGQQGVRMRAEDTVKKILFCRETDCSLEATVGQSVPQEVRTGSAARYVESCWQCVPRAPSSNPLTYRFHLQESVTSQQRCRGRAKRNPQRSLNWQGLPWQWNYWWFLFFSIFPLHLPSFLRWTEVSAVVWFGEKTALSLDLWVACQGLKDVLYPAFAMLPAGPPKRPQAWAAVYSPAPAALLPTHSGRRAFPDTPPLSPPWSSSHRGDSLP